MYIIWILLKWKGGNSFLENIYHSSQKTDEQRQNYRKSACDFNLEQIAAQERDKNKTPMEQYYQTPTKKVGSNDNINYDNWTGENIGVFDAINRSAEKTAQERKVLAYQLN